jgi:hypothetical protein
MSLRRYLPRLVLAAGAVASIATEAVTQPWALETREGLVPQILDDTTPTNVRALKPVLASNQALSFVEASVTVQLELHARDATGARPAEVVVELASATSLSDLDRQVVSIPPGGTATAELALPALAACGGVASCEDRFELRLRRTPLDGDPSIEVTGSVAVDANSEGRPGGPTDAALSLDVADLGPVP